MTEKFPYCCDGMTDWLAIANGMCLDDVVAEYVDLVALTVGGVEVGSDAYTEQGYNPNSQSIIRSREATQYQKGKGYKPRAL